MHLHHRIERSASILPKITASRRMSEGFQFQTGARMGASAAVCGTPPRLYVSGGEVFNKSDSVPDGMQFDVIGSLQSIDIAKLNDPKHPMSQQWLDHPDMLYPRRDHTLSCYQDQLFAVGKNLESQGCIVCILRSMVLLFFLFVFLYSKHSNQICVLISNRVTPKTHMSYN